MVAEFHNTNFTCSPDSIVPSGPDYTDVAYQTCAEAGSRIGTTLVNGDDYLAAQFGFYHSHVWRDFGILVAFTVFYVAMTCWLNEVLEWDLDNAGPIQYKKSQKRLADKRPTSRDEESNPVQVDTKAPPPGSTDPMPNSGLTGTMSTFTWDSLNLNVQTPKETRTLLNGVCGYCKPGTLTALVGASGAGKSTCKTTLEDIMAKGKLTPT